ncbi:MAG: 50S ribosomal protein L32 [Candidatus Peregrinibacteria bacterium GW2011_GWA2_33_10]|nr:MAG: 50S ribosomal protein L32 [Candidatus Peregrinibacteria bacterium GW2011_GWA2_33_10]
MAKHPVPKKKTSKGRTSRRYAEFKNSVIKRLNNTVRLENCPTCATPKLLHKVCASCGTYKGKQIINKSKEIEKGQQSKP